MICKIFGHKWRKTEYFGNDGLECIICKQHVKKCKRCNALKCDCRIIK